jgi:hypothetical protein
MSITRKSRLVWVPTIVYGRDWNDGKPSYHTIEEMTDEDYKKEVLQSKTHAELLKHEEDLYDDLESARNRITEDTFVTSDFHFEFEGDDGEFHIVENFKDYPERCGDLFGPKEVK